MKTNLHVGSLVTRMRLAEAGTLWSRPGSGNSLPVGRIRPSDVALVLEVGKAHESTQQIFVRIILRDRIGWIDQYFLEEVEIA